jgi:DNA-binding response OmpR family regulator
MFSDKPVLIVEDNVFLAVDLSEAIEELEGRIVGPTGRVAEALDLLDSEEVAAAIVNAHLTDLDVFMLTSRLTQLGVPFVIQAESDLPETVSFLHPEIPVLRKPTHPSAVLSCLLREMHKNGKLEQAEVSQPKLAFPAKLV